MSAVHIILGAPKAEEIKPLIQEDGIVIGVDRGALFAIEEEIDLAVAIGDFDSISDDEVALIEKFSKLKLQYPTDKDDTDTELALLYVKEHYPNSSIYLYNWYGGRIDHLYSILFLSIQKRFESLIPNLNLISEKNVISYYLPGEHQIGKIDPMDYLSYVLLTEVENLTLNQVKYPLTEASYKQPIALISNEFLSDKATFFFDSGIVAAIQSRD